MTSGRQWEFIYLKESLETKFICLEIIIVRIRSDINHGQDRGISVWRLFPIWEVQQHLHFFVIRSYKWEC